MTQSKPYAILKRRVDGVLHYDGPNEAYGESPLDLEMRPVGRELPRERQSRELEVAIGMTSTVLDEDGIAALKEFLEMKP